MDPEDSDESGEDRPYSETELTLPPPTAALEASCWWFNPFNPHNVEITEPEVQTLLRTYGLPGTVRNLHVYRRAFVHRSYTKRPAYINEQMNVRVAPCPDGCLPLKTKSNERMEFVGDGLLDCVTKLYLYKRFPKKDEHFMTDKKIDLVNNERLGQISCEMGLPKWLLISRFSEEKKLRTNHKKLGCLFEAFLAAVFFDNEPPAPPVSTHKPPPASIVRKTPRHQDHGSSAAAIADWPTMDGPGFLAVKTFLVNVFERHIDWSTLVSHNGNYKGLLQNRVQKLFRQAPVYAPLSPHHPHNGFHMGVFVHLGGGNPAAPVPLQSLQHWDHLTTVGAAASSVLLGEGCHPNKRKAEQNACEEALALLDRLSPHSV